MSSVLDLQAMSGPFFILYLKVYHGKYENLFTQQYHIPRGQRPRGIWYSWVNKFSYFLYPHAINVLWYRMKPRKHIYVKYCWQTYFKSIGTLSEIFKNHIVTVANKCSYFPLQHAINVYYDLIVKFYMFYKVFFIFNYFWGFGFLVFYCLVFYCLVTFDIYCDWSKTIVYYKTSSELKRSTSHCC
jgi:hypothetical protein